MILLGITALVITVAAYFLCRNERIKSVLGIFHISAYIFMAVVIIQLFLGCSISCLLNQDSRIHIFPDLMFTSSGLTIHTHVLHSGYGLSVAGFALDLWGTIVVATAVLLPLSAFAVSRFSTRALLRQYIASKNDARSKSLRRMYGSSEVEFLVADVDELDVFSIPVLNLRPKRRSARDIIVITENLIRHLEEDELEAVIAHEMAHIMDRDDRFYPFYKSIGMFFFFDPVIQYLIGRFVRRKELKADRYAALTTQKPRSLAKALLKVYEAREKVKSDGLAALMRNDYSLLKERIVQLLDIARDMETEDRTELRFDTIRH